MNDYQLELEQDQLQESLWQQYEDFSDAKCHEQVKALIKYCQNMGLSALANDMINGECAKYDEYAV